MGGKLDFHRGKYYYHGCTNNTVVIPLPVVFRKHTALWKHGWGLLSLLLAFNYFSFRVELFSDEDEQNHPVTDPGTHQTAFSPSSVNWETFDKDNAPKAITVRADVQIELFSIVQCPVKISRHNYQPDQPIRDKSPPINLLP